MIVLNYGNTSGPDVFFDDLTIEYKESSLIQTTACYPYGMTAYTWMRDAEILNRYGFQGKEWEDKTQWYDFHAKQYDPILRWGGGFAPGPANQFASGYMGMGNNPIIGLSLLCSFPTKVFEYSNRYENRFSRRESQQIYFLKDLWNFVLPSFVIF